MLKVKVNDEVKITNNASRNNLRYSQIIAGVTKFE